MSKKTGIPADLVYGRWWFETGGFTNRGFTDLHNLSGIKNPGGKGYRDFRNLEDFANYESGQLEKNWPKAMGAQTPEALTAGLAEGKRGPWAESMATAEGRAAYTAGTQTGVNTYHLIYQMPITINTNDVDGAKEKLGPVIKDAGKDMVEQIRGTQLGLR